MISMTLPYLIWKFQTKFCFDKLLFKIKNKKKENSSKKVISNKQQWFFNNYLLIFAWLFFWPIGLYGSIKRHKFLNSNSVRDSSSKIKRNAADKADEDKYQLDQLEKSKKLDDEKNRLVDESQNQYYKKAIDWEMNKKFAPFFTIIFFSSWIYLFWLFDDLYPSDSFAIAFWASVPLFIIEVLILNQLELWYKSFFSQKLLKKVKIKEKEYDSKICSAKEIHSTTKKQLTEFIDKLPKKNKDELKMSISKLKAQISKVDVLDDKYLKNISKTKGKHFVPRYSFINSIEESIKSLNNNFLKSQNIYSEKLKLDELELIQKKKSEELIKKNDDLIDNYIDSLK